MRVAVLMPTFNEKGRLTSSLNSLRAVTSSALRLHVFLVDDGSTLPCVLAPQVTGPDFAISLARHLVNLGQGAALETARQLALLDSEGFDAFVTMDSDGQHSPSDLPTLLDAIRGGADAVFGNRFAGESNPPFGRRLILRAAALFERVSTGLAVTDAHNGYRAFSKAGIESIALTQDRMAHATEIKQQVSRAKKLKVTEVPVSIVYSDDTLAKGQSSIGALQIIKDLLYQFIFASRNS